MTQEGLTREQDSVKPRGEGGRESQSRQLGLCQQTSPGPASEKLDMIFFFFFFFYDLLIKNEVQELACSPGEGQMGG